MKSRKYPKYDRDPLEVLEDPPPGSQCFINGQYLKIGRYNKVFSFRNGEWVLASGITVDDITRELIKLERRTRRKV